MPTIPSYPPPPTLALELLCTRVSVYEHSPSPLFTPPPPPLGPD